MHPLLDVVNGDVLTTRADVLVVKYADAPHGVDAAVARAIGKNLKTASGRHAFFATEGRIAAREVLVLGVGPLARFEYKQIQRFARDALTILGAERPGARDILFTLHGPGYGLDELACSDSLIRGIKSAAADRRIRIVDRDQRRVERIASLLGHAPQAEFTPERAEKISRNDTFDRRLFTAMPFKDSFRDHWELVIEPVGHEFGYVCERLDHEAFHGDILSEIKNRIERSSAVLALLDELNANVFLEVGYAWGVGRPTLLMLQNGVEAPFDVQGHNIIRYGRLGELKKKLSGMIGDLLRQGEL